jgi:2-desacetyl-2-hydroxyethyl bacteriochlorophyllide A dehydrogenase
VRSAVFHGPRDIRLEELPDPLPGPGEALVRVRAAGICGGDLHEYRAGRQLYPTPYPRPAQGHELAGEVVAVGTGRYGVSPQVGDRVAVQPMISCGACAECDAGRLALCSQLQHLGVALPGGFAELCLAPVANVFRLPEGVSDTEGALLDCTAVAVHALRRVPVEPGERVTVLGAGAIGLAVAQLAAARGGEVTVVATRARPLAIARELGLARVVDLGAGERPPAGADVVFETAGGDDLLVRALAAAGPGARVGLVGESFAAQPLDLATAMPRELAIVFVWSHDGRSEFEQALALAAAGTVRLEPAVTHRFALETLPQAFAAASERDRSDAVKVVVTP